MATTRVILRTSKTNQKGLAPLYLRITYQRKTSFIALKLNIPLKNWDEVQDRVKPKSPNAQEINSCILQKQSELEKSWLKAKRENVSIQVHELKEQIYGKAEIDFFEVGSKQDSSDFVS
jgi:integrase/recombinase XerD